MKEAFFFDNGNVSVVAGESQVPELQKPWILTFAEFLESIGEDPASFLLHLPAGDARFFRISAENGGGWNWMFESYKRKEENGQEE